VRDRIGGMREPPEGPAQAIVRPAVLPAAMFGRITATFQPVVGLSQSTVVMSEGFVGPAQPIVVLHQPTVGASQAIETMRHRIVRVRQWIFSTSRTLVSVRELVGGMRQSGVSMRLVIVALRQSTGAGVGSTVTRCRSSAQARASTQPGRGLREQILNQFSTYITLVGSESDEEENPKRS
jgi:hypothetical protein